MILAIEDQLSEVIVRKLISSIRPDIVVTQAIGGSGYGYLKSKADSLNRTASGYPVFILTDQDSPTTCPVQIISTWLSGRPNSKLLFRVAVMEVEAWVLAHRAAVARHLEIPVGQIPTNVETIVQPKEFLISLARQSRNKNVKADLVPKLGGTAKVGPAYNSRLSSFVLNEWDPVRAAASSQSLERAIRRLRLF